MRWIPLKRAVTPIGETPFPAPEWCLTRQLCI